MQGLVYLPPFAEEMNRARRMAALQARRLADLGIDVLLLDPFGTGDSAGQFCEARWEIWREDAKVALGWLEQRTGAAVGLWGLRLGALLAAEVAAEAPDRPARLLLWQPVLTGERHLTQFLRLQLAAGMAEAGARTSTRELRARLGAGETLEIAGYELAPDLAEAIAELTLAEPLARLGRLPVDWLEVAGDAPADLAPASRAAVERAQAAGIEITAGAVTGPPFWAIQEITLAPALLDATDALFRP